MKMRVTIGEQQYEVEVGDLRARPVLATVNGAVYEVWPEGAEATGAGTTGAGTAGAGGKMAALTLDTPQNTPAAAGNASVQPGAAVLAPIPGVILSVNVKEGDSVSFGQELCVLEAMKMKNQIRANRAGVIAALCVAPGDQVKHGQVLMEYTR